MAKLASALAHLKTKKLRIVVQKAQKLLAAPTGGCKKLRLKRRGDLKVSAQKRALSITLMITIVESFNPILRRALNLPEEKVRTLARLKIRFVEFAPGHFKWPNWPAL